MARTIRAYPNKVQKHGFEIRNFATRLVVLTDEVRNKKIHIFGFDQRHSCVGLTINTDFLNSISCFANFSIDVKFKGTVAAKLRKIVGESRETD